VVRIPHLLHSLISAVRVDHSCSPTHQLSEVSGMNAMITDPNSIKF